MAKSNAKLNEEQKQHVSKMGLIIIAQVVIMVVLTIIMVIIVSNRIDKMIVADNTAITKEKCAELELYMQNSSTILTNYTAAPEILNVIKNPDDPAAVEAAQKYTEKISQYTGEIVLVGINYDDNKGHTCEIERFTKE